MRKPKFLLLMGLALMVAVLPWGGNLAFGNTGPAGVTWYANSPSGPESFRQRHGNGIEEICRLTAGFNRSRRQQSGAVYSRCDVADTALYPDCDYYEIGDSNYTKKVHTDLPKAHQIPGLC